MFLLTVIPVTQVQAGSHTSAIITIKARDPVEQITSRDHRSALIIFCRSIRSCYTELKHQIQMPVSPIVGKILPCYADHPRRASAGETWTVVQHRSAGGLVYKNCRPIYHLSYPIIYSLIYTMDPVATILL